MRIQVLSDLHREFGHVPLPDVAAVADRRSAAIEFNTAWRAGINGCNAPKVLRAVLAASGKV